MARLRPSPLSTGGPHESPLLPESCPWRESLMYDVAALAIALACFAFIYAVFYLLERV